MDYSDLIKAINETGNAYIALLQNRPIDRINKTIGELAASGFTRSGLKKSKLEEDKLRLEVEKAKSSQTPAYQRLGDVEQQTLSEQSRINKEKFEKLKRQALGLEPLPVGESFGGPNTTTIEDSFTGVGPQNRPALVNTPGKTQIDTVLPPEEFNRQKMDEAKQAFQSRTGMYPDLTIAENNDLLNKRSLIDYRTAQTSSLQNKNILNKKIGELFPSMTDQQITEIYGEGINRETPFSAADRLGRFRAQQTRQGQMIPISALSPEAQEAAIRSGLPDIIPLVQARVLMQGNPIRMPTAEESQQLATAESLSDKFSQVTQKFNVVGDQALGVGKYHVNKYGQYIPWVESDPDVVDFYTNINSINNAMIYYMSGKQINENEEKRIRAELLEPELNPDAFAQRLQTAQRNFDYLRSLKDKAIANVGKRTPFGAEPTQPTTPKIKSTDELLQKYPFLGK